MNRPVQPITPEELERLLHYGCYRGIADAAADAVRRGTPVEWPWQWHPAWALDPYGLHKTTNEFGLANLEDGVRLCKPVGSFEFAANLADQINTEYWNNQCDSSAPETKSVTP